MENPSSSDQVAVPAEEEATASDNKDEKPKNRRGRPKGAKNKRRYGVAGEGTVMLRPAETHHGKNIPRDESPENHRAITSTPGTGAEGGAYRRRLDRNFALLLRDAFPPELLVGWVKASLMGYDPVLAPDPTGPGGMCVEFDPVPLHPPTWEQKWAVWQAILNRQYGLPVQHIALEAAIQAQSATLNVNADLAAISAPGFPAALRATILGALQQGLAGNRAQLPAASGVVSGNALDVGKEEPDV